MAHPASQAYFESFNSDYKTKYTYFNCNTFKIIYSGDDDEEYQKFLQIKNTYPSIWYDKCKVEDMPGSILSAAPDYSLAISVSADLKMNNGIAAKFKEKYSCMEIFKEQNAETGGLAFVKHRDTERFIYYLVVTPVYNAHPTYYTIWMSLKKLKENVLKYDIKRIAMSHIGCNPAAGITWDFVKPMIEYIFKDVSIDINAYEGKSPCILSHDIEDCFCYGYSLVPSRIENFNFNQGAMAWENEYYNYNQQEQKNNNYKYCANQAVKAEFSEYSSLLGKGNFWEYNNQTRDCYKYGTQGEHSAYNTFNTQTNTESIALGGEENNHGTQKEEDVYHKYCIKVGNDYYVKYSTEDAANDYYGALY